jgi:hypothetical protein
MTAIPVKRQPNPLDEQAGTHIYAVLLGVVRSGALAIHSDPYLVMQYAAAVTSSVVVNPKMLRVLGWEMHNLLAGLHARGLALSEYNTENNPCNCPHDHDWDRDTCDVVRTGALQGDYRPGMQALDKLIENPPVAEVDVLGMGVQVFAPYLCEIMRDIVKGAQKASQN